MRTLRDLRDSMARSVGLNGTTAPSGSTASRPCRPLWAALALAGLLCAPVGVRAENILNLHPPGEYLYEGDGWIYVGVELVRDAPGMNDVVSATFITEEGTATDGLDYYGTTEDFVWEAGVEEIYYVEIPLVDDELPEPTETFYISLTNEVNADYWGRWELFLVDNDSGLPKVRAVFCGPSTSCGQTRVIPIEGGFHANSVKVVFEADAPDEDVLPLEIIWINGFSSGPQYHDLEGVGEEELDLGPLPKVSSIQTGTLWIPPQERLSPEGSEFHTVKLAVIPIAQVGVEYCVICVLSYVLGMIESDYCDPVCGSPDCPPLSSGVRAPRGGLSPSVVLRGYRDDVLLGSEGGQYYTELFDDIQVPVMRAVIAHPNLLGNFRAVEVSWIPAFADLVAGRRSAYVITAQMQADLTALLDGLIENSDAMTSAQLEAERALLGLDALTGLTMETLQNRLDTLGGTSSVKETSWGSVKARYR